MPFTNIVPRLTAPLIMLTQTVLTDMLTDPLGITLTDTLTDPLGIHAD